MERPETSMILQEYQADEDALVAYRPRIMGSVDIPLTPVRVITRGEAEMLDELTYRTGIIGLLRFSEIHDEAFRESRERYVDKAVPAPHLTEKEGIAWIFNDGHRDAYRHAYWNAMLVQEYGAEWAERFATAHERLPSNSPEREAMDLYNNRIGREIAVGNPGASPAPLADMIQQAVDQGKMLVIDGEGNLAWSDQVAVGQHGTAKKMEQGQDHVAPDIQQHSYRALPLHDSPYPLPATRGMQVLYASCVDCIDQMDIPFPLTDDAKANLTGSLMCLADQNNMARVDHAFFSQRNDRCPDGHFLIAIQGSSNDPAHARAHMQTSGALETPFMSSLAALMEKPTQQITLDAVQLQLNDHMQERATFRIS